MKHRFVIAALSTLSTLAIPACIPVAEDDTPESADLQDDALTPRGTGVTASPVHFNSIVLDSNAPGPAFATVGDFNKDGKLDIVISSFGTLLGMVGEVQLYLQGKSLSEWTKTTLLPTSAGYPFPNRISAADVDGDGDLDLFVPSGFLATEAAFKGASGAMQWLENTGDFTKPWPSHVIVPKGNSLFFHQAVFVDFDGDGIKDIVTVGERKPVLGSATAQVQWYKGNLTADRFEKTARVIGSGLGSLPSVLDVDGDGDLDIASAEYFVPGGSFAWMERTSNPSPSNPNGTFVRRIIDKTSGPSIQLSFVSNLLGNNKTVAVGSNHTNTRDKSTNPESGVFLFTPGADPTQPWARKQISTGIQSDKSPFGGPMGAPGIFGNGDMDGDGDKDLIVSGDGDPNVYWLEQTSPGQFATHIFDTNNRQAGGMIVADLNNDGKNEMIVTGYETKTVKIFTR